MHIPENEMFRSVSCVQKNAYFNRGNAHSDAIFVHPESKQDNSIDFHSLFFLLMSYIRCLHVIHGKNHMCLYCLVQDSTECTGNDTAHVAY